MKAEPHDKLPAPRQAQEPTATPAASREIYDYAALADALNTQRSYLSDWKHFVSWCQVRRFSPLPCNPDQLAQYVRYCVERLGLKTSTVSRRLAAINQAHVRNGFASPAGEWVVKKTMQRLRREHGKPARGKDPVLTKDLRRMIAALPQNLSGTRDKAILLLGFAGGMRRSEIVGWTLRIFNSAKKVSQCRYDAQRRISPAPAGRSGFRTAKTPSPAPSKPSSRGLSWRRSTVRAALSRGEQMEQGITDAAF